MILACILIGCFHNFSLDPYHEPLPWFMICSRNNKATCQVTNTLQIQQYKYVATYILKLQYTASHIRIKLQPDRDDDNVANCRGSIRTYRRYDALFHRPSV